MEFARLLNHLAGRAEPAVQARLDAGAIPRADVAAAQRLLAAGRRALAAPRLSRKARRRALRIFRDARPKPAARPSVLRLLTDTLLRPAPALRSGTAAQARFLRFGGEITIELQITPRGRGVEVRGQVTPAGRTDAVTLTSGGVTKRARIDAAGEFVVRAIPRGPVELDFGIARVTDLTL